MPDSEVVRIMRDFKRGLLASEREQMVAMSRAWLSVERTLNDQMSLLAEQMTRISRDGGTVSVDLLFQEERYRRLLSQLTDELGRYTTYAERTITDRQAQLARLGIDHAVSAIEAQGVSAGFARLPVEAVQNMVGLAGDGSPLRTLLQASWPDAAQGMTSALVKGVALGWNPRKTARAMAAGSTRSLDRMMNISRSESMRVYRTANLESYRASGVVRGYRRLAARSTRTCLACMIRDGEFFELDREMDEHASGRCTSCPVVTGVPEPTWQLGRDWLMEQPEKTQRLVMGVGRYNAWQRGMFDLADAARTVPNATWGDSLRVTPLRELV